MTTSDTYPEPISEAMRVASHRYALKVLGLAVEAAIVWPYLKTRREQAQTAHSARIRRFLNEQLRAEREAARTRWASANDPGWLERADLIDTARAWSAAVPYADIDADAATAAHDCEARLRVIHPQAMAHYDRLRADGQSRSAAMTEAAPLFANPSGRTAESGPRSHAQEPGRPEAEPSGAPGPDASSTGRAPGENVAEQSPYTIEQYLRYAAEHQADASDTNASPPQAPTAQNQVTRHPR